MTLRPSAAASLGRLGVGFANTTGLNCTLHTSGSLGVAVLGTAGAPTFDETKCVVYYTGGAPVTWSLPTAGTVSGQMFVLGNKTANTVTLSQSVSSGQTTPITTISDGEWVVAFADASGYHGFKVSSL
jgi:hypothetical protein